MAKKKIEKKEQEIIIPTPTLIDWYIPDYIITRFASQMTVQILESEFKISFFELKPDIKLDPNQPPPSKVKAECVSSIIVTPNRLAKFIEVLQRQLDVYNTKIKPQV